MPQGNIWSNITDAAVSGAKPWTSTVEAQLWLDTWSAFGTQFGCSANQVTGSDADGGFHDLLEMYINFPDSWALDSSMPSLILRLSLRIFIWGSVGSAANVGARLTDGGTIVNYITNTTAVEYQLIRDYRVTDTDFPVGPTTVYAQYRCISGNVKMRADWSPYGSYWYFLVV